MGGGKGRLNVLYSVTAELCGFQVERFWDLGVAGIHRLLSHCSTLTRADVLIVVAGMEGALPSLFPFPRSLCPYPCRIAPSPGRSLLLAWIATARRESEPGPWSPNWLSTTSPTSAPRPFGLGETHPWIFTRRTSFSR
jgi:hypothetical protein